MFVMERYRALDFAPGILRSALWAGDDGHGICMFSKRLQ
jgi:hypothetical protein